jgi:hypothetical protein
VSQAKHLDGPAEVPAAATTSVVCQTVIKPLTVPRGCVCTPTLVNEEGRRDWYSLAYTDEATGKGHSTAPRGTRSYCEVLAADPATSRFVGRPNIFLSHAWLFNFRELVEDVVRYARRLTQDYDWQASRFETGDPAELTPVRTIARAFLLHLFVISPYDQCLKPRQPLPAVLLVRYDVDRRAPHRRLAGGVVGQQL